VRSLVRWQPAATSFCIPAILAWTLVCIGERYFVDSEEAMTRRYCNRGDALLADGKPDGARTQFEQALQHDSGDARAHFRLGEILEKAQPREATEHYRAALARTPDNFLTLQNLGNLMMREGDFAEATRLYRAALKVDPGDTNVRAGLDSAARWLASMDRVSAAVLRLACDTLGETREAGSSEEGVFLRRSRERIADASGHVLIPGVDLYWRIPPPGGGEIQVLGPKGTTESQQVRQPFYACSATLSGAKRLFVFPPPRNVVLLADEDVSWCFQVRLSELTEQERQQEDAFRRERGLDRFPLSKLPE
jgi:tetratricopeptide (TPR) repeat protein